MIEDIYKRVCTEVSDINQHLPVLRDYSGRCRYVTEFGVRDMVSTWALLAGRPYRLISYDICRPGADYYALTTVAKQIGVDYGFVLGDTLKVDIEPTELLFIDTLHTYGQLKGEFERHAGKVKKWIILHDTETFGIKSEIEGEGGLWPAVEEFLAAGGWKIVERRTNNNGLTVLERV